MCRDYKKEDKLVIPLSLNNDKNSKIKFLVSINNSDDLYKTIYKGFDYNPEI